jgi:hypothetical protein
VAVQFRGLAVPPELNHRSSTLTTIRGLVHPTNAFLCITHGLGIDLDFTTPCIKHPSLIPQLIFATSNPTHQHVPPNNSPRISTAPALLARPDATCRNAHATHLLTQRPLPSHILAQHTRLSAQASRTRLHHLSACPPRKNRDINTSYKPAIILAHIQLPRLGRFLRTHRRHSLYTHLSHLFQSLPHIHFQGPPQVQSRLNKPPRRTPTATPRTNKGRFRNRVRKPTRARKRERKSWASPCSACWVEVVAAFAAGAVVHILERW